MPPIFLVIYAFGLIWLVYAGWRAFRRERERKQRQLEVEARYPVGEALIFRGTYIYHWEIERFEWLPEGEEPPVGWSDYKCKLEIPFEGGWTWMQEVMEEHGGSARAASGESFDIEFLGRILEIGHFGHLGICRYRIEMLELLSVKRKRGCQ